jgi:hypothetical protein
VLEGTSGLDVTGHVTDGFLDVVPPERINRGFPTPRLNDPAYETRTHGRYYGTRVNNTPNEPRVLVSPGGDRVNVD